VSELRWPRRSVRSNDRCSLTRTDGKRGPNSLRATRAGTPALQLIRFLVLGPPFCGAERRAGAMGWGRSLSKFGPSKDDAGPMGEQSMRGAAMAAQSVRSNDRCSLTRTDGNRGPNSHRATRAGTPALQLIRFLVLGQGQGPSAAARRSRAIPLKSPKIILILRHDVCYQ
jgi:hypothetical protein